MSRKIQTFFGPAGTRVLYSCMCIVATSAWLLDHLYACDFEKNHKCKINRSSMPSVASYFISPDLVHYDF